jgi:hypothetical protein
MLASAHDHAHHSNWQLSVSPAATVRKHKLGVPQSVAGAFCLFFLETIEMLPPSDLAFNDL